MKHLTTCLALCVFSSIAAQPVVNNAEDFSIGNVLKFINCSTSGVSPGGNGANQTWDFSGLISLGDTITERMVLPSNTPNGALFPTANQVEKYSDGRFVYVNKTATGSYLVGFADTTAAYPPTIYPDPMLFAIRPMSYNTVYTDNFTIYGSPAIGTITITPDAYGTLILPNGTYTNVLREKVVMVHPYYSSTSYFWFNGITTSTLLKLEQNTDVEYLSQNPVITSIKKNESEKPFCFYPNPATGMLYFDDLTQGHLVIVNSSGNAVKENDVNPDTKSISIEGLLPGMYVLCYSTKYASLHKKLIIQ